MQQTRYQKVEHDVSHLLLFTEVINIVSVINLIKVKNRVNMAMVAQLPGVFMITRFYVGTTEVRNTDHFPANTETVIKIFQRNMILMIKCMVPNTNKRHYW